MSRTLFTNVKVLDCSGAEPFAVKCTRSAESVKHCARHGVKVIYHANFADEEAMDLLEANKDWVFVSPTSASPRSLRGKFHKRV